MMQRFFKLVALGIFLLQPVFGWSQDTDAASSALEKTWVAPDIVALPVDWWPQFNSKNPEVFRLRAKLLLARVNEYISGLDAENLVIAHTGLNTLRANLDAVSTLLGVDPVLQIKTLPTLESYSLQQLLDLRGLWRDADRRLKLIELEQQHLERQISLLSQRRDLLLNQYSETDPNSPARMLAGLHRINVYLELYNFEIQLEINTQQQAQLKKYLDDTEKKIKYASENLYVDQLSLADLDATIQALSDELTKARNKLALVQQKLLDAVNVDQPETFSILNFKQQLTQASVEELLAQLKVELAYARRDWFLLRSGAAASTHDLHMNDPMLKSLTRDAAQQSALWTHASRNTLITPAPDKGRKARKDYEEAQKTAHRTLSLIDDVNATLDNLAVVKDLVTNAAVTSSRGFGNGWLRVRLFSQLIGEKSKELFNVSLFHIAERPVTAGGMAKAILIFLVFWALSWAIRHLLDRIERRKHFEQGSFYAGGRVLHYLILTIAGIAALGSIGLDFRTFALIAGALSVGIGFGLQSVVLNFVSGLILLFEGSIRVGDYVQLDSGNSNPDLMGVVRDIRSRATRINTNDNVDVIVPNSELVGNRMINWTLRESTARMRIPFSVAYGSDKELVKKACQEAAAEGEFCIQHSPAFRPGVRLIRLGNNGLEFELRVWVNRQGIRRPIFVRSSVLWALDTRFREYGIRVPFPQRDVHFPADSRFSQAAEAQSFSDTGDTSLEPPDDE